MNNNCCYTNKCYNAVLAIIGALFAFVLGLILGVVFTATLTPLLATLIIVAIILAVLFIVFLILRFCGYGYGCQERCPKQRQSDCYDRCR